MLIKSLSGKSINSIEEWKAFSPPASQDLHWVFVPGGEHISSHIPFFIGKVKTSIPSLII
ncbi:hypothetical protein [Fictibacillus terranigra]|uniref:Uncharacterized protein n=1 Tax=Fictibacillus terranigra TaxID=3058424 RepID=A0ABT8E596_9BACL|nr:hypothetical protein [Fictibacillus sp. CENA-BCM004]MDN4073080.1 hypothetical protein [Fictibacillus sp. CENA-BCM004]